MACIELNTQERDQEKFAKKSQIWTLISLFRRVLHVDRSRHASKLSHHLAKDIGLSSAELARLQHKWPAEHTHHPRG